MLLGCLLGVEGHTVGAEPDPLLQLEALALLQAIHEERPDDARLVTEGRCAGCVGAELANLNLVLLAAVSTDAGRILDLITSATVDKIRDAGPAS